jgi:hypothetical protein
MNWLRNHLFNSMAAVSLLLSIVTAVAWYGSHLGGQHWVHVAAYGRGPVVADGTIEFGILGKPQPFVEPKSGLRSWGLPSDAPRGTKPDIEDNTARVIRWQIAGMTATVGRIFPPWGWKSDANGIWGTLPTVAIPYKEYDVSIVYAQFLFGLAPILWFARHARRLLRPSSGFCHVCGYDLRATRDRCPECGTIPAKAEMPPK